MKKKTQKIHAVIKKTYPQDFCCLSFVKKWLSRFDKGDYDLEDKPRSGRPENFSTQKLEQLLDKNAKTTTRELAKKLNFSQSSVYRKLIKIGKRPKKCIEIPHELTLSQKQKRKKVCMNLIK